MNDNEEDCISFLSGYLFFLEGPICAGKSTLLRTCRRYGKRDQNKNDVIFFEEDIPEKWIEEYKKELESTDDESEKMKFSMNLQEKIMDLRELEVNIALDHVAHGRTVVMERGTLGNLVFALNAFSKYKDQEKIFTLFAKYVLRMSSLISKRPVVDPHKVITIYLKTDVEEAIARNGKRDKNHPYEPAYMYRLQEIYEQMLEAVPAEQLLVVDMRKLCHDDFGGDCELEEDYDSHTSEYRYKAYFLLKIQQLLKEKMDMVTNKLVDKS